MNKDQAKIEALLQQMRNTFLDELEYRCDQLEQMVLGLDEKQLDDEQETFDELYRAVHSLKGSGGTHGIGIITTLCHQFENLLTESACSGHFSQSYTQAGIKYVDLIRQINSLARKTNPDYAPVEAEVERLQSKIFQSQHIGLVAEPSPMMSRLYQQALAELPVQLTIVDSGLAALERLVWVKYDFIILAKELKDLNGIAVISALQTSQGKNQNIPIILITSRKESVSNTLKIQRILTRDQQLVNNLPAALMEILNRNTNAWSPKR